MTAEVHRVLGRRLRSGPPPPPPHLSSLDPAVPGAWKVWQPGNLRGSIFLSHSPAQAVLREAL